jgi:hypothetical protein
MYKAGIEKAGEEHGRSGKATHLVEAKQAMQKRRNGRGSGRVAAGEKRGHKERAVQREMKRMEGNRIQGRFNAEKT